MALDTDVIPRLKTKKNPTKNMFFCQILPGFIGYWLSVRDWSIDLDSLEIGRRRCGRGLVESSADGSG